MNLNEQQIARLLGVPSSRVQAFWPKISECLSALCGDAYTDAVQIAALATIRVECPPFAPTKEWTGPEGEARFVRMYWDNEHVRHMLGNLSPEDAIKFCGRGFNQLTGRDNYRVFGGLIGVDLLSDPEKANQDDTACALFAAYFHQRHNCTDRANALDWVGVRKAVNGGTNSLKLFLTYIQILGDAAGLADIKATALEQMQRLSAPAQAASAGG